MTLVREAIAVWTDHEGVPKRIVWVGRRYRVSDTPTLLESDYDYVPMHPPTAHPGWRFQGTDESHDSLMFEARYVASRDEWLLLRVYK